VNFDRFAAAAQELRMYSPLLNVKG